MIKEDYVSFEVAKLLKEKGFEQFGCNKQYNTQGDLCSGFCYGPVAPTHQMAMKWLREIHKVVISIDAHTANHWDGYIDTFEIDILKNASRIIVPDKIAIHNIYEEAVEAALKYSLENLI